MQAAAAVVRQSKKYAAELNLFIDQACRSDPFHSRTMIISTRIYIVLLTVSIIILVVFSSLGTQFQTITKRNPSQADYEVLLGKYPNSLSCPCNRVTIPYGNFTSTNVDYHPVCSSVFVSDDWIKHLFSPNIGSLYQGDFRASASSYFQLLAAFCSHVSRTVTDELDNFHSETLLTPDVLLQESFNTTVQVKSEFLKASIENNVRQLILLVRSTTRTNELQTALQTSKILLKKGTFPGLDHVSYSVSDSPNCFCEALSNCSAASGFFDVQHSQIDQGILTVGKQRANATGFVIGCTAVESVLQSTLECLFDCSCLENIRTYIPSSNISGIYPLNTIQSRFAPNTSIERITNDLFIEKWSTEQSFSIYFGQCAPVLCTYTLEERNNVLYVITKLLGLYGGLTAALRLCVPLIVGWWRKPKVSSSKYRY
jgi:hypothetical protein